MVAHRRDDRFRGQLQILLIEFAAECRRVLDKIENLFEKVSRDLRPAAVLRGGRFDAGADPFPALLWVDEDKRLLARRFIACRIRDFKAAVPQEAMAARYASAPDVRDLERHDVSAEERDDPADRANEFEIERAPAHAVRKAQPADESRQDLAQKRCRLLARLMHHRVDVAILRHEILRVDMPAMREALRRLRRIAVRVECDRDGRSTAFARDVLLLFGNSRDEKRRAARRADRADRGKCDTVFVQRSRRILLEFLQNARHDVRGDFFRSDFE